MKIAALCSYAKGTVYGRGDLPKVGGLDVETNRDRDRERP